MHLIKKIFSKSNTKLQSITEYKTNVTLDESLLGFEESPLKKHKINKFKLGDKILVWDFDEDIHDVRHLPVNNLYIENLWRMEDTAGKGELCVGINIIDDNNFNFTTFNCFCYCMHIENNQVL